MKDVGEVAAIDLSMASSTDEPAPRDWLGGLDNPDQFGANWLERLASSTPGFVGARLRIADASGALKDCGERIVDTAAPDDVRAVLHEAAYAAAKRAMGVARRLEGGEGVAAGYPLLVDGRVSAVVAVVIHGEAKPDAALEGLRWAAGWIRARLLDAARSTDAPNVERARQAVALLGGALDEEGFKASARRATTELARLAACDRVSIGFRRGRHCRVVALSDAATFGHRMDVVRRIEVAMDEALSQQATILDPPPEGSAPLITREHEMLRRAVGAAEVVTVPIFARDRFRGGICFERAAGAPFDQPTLDLIGAAVALVGPALEDRRRADRWLVVKAWDAFVRGLTRIFGVGHLKTKLALTAAIALGLAAGTLQGPYQVTAKASIEGQVERALIAPFDGYVAAAAARAGDVVKGGSTLARLDDRDLSLERLNWQSERRRRALEYQKAVGDRDRARQNELRAEIAQADAQVAFLDAQIARSRILAPFDAVVVSGDLSQTIGGAVARGELLFRIAPLDDYRVVMWIDESRIDDVGLGDRGRLVLGALPTEDYVTEISKVTPVAEARDGKNMFRVEARVASGDISRLRPGMNGVTKIDLEDRLLVVNWTKSLVDWARLAWWRWLG